MKWKDQIKARREGNPSNTEPSEVLKSHATNLNGILSDTAQFGLNWKKNNVTWNTPPFLKKAFYFMIK